MRRLWYGVRLTAAVLACATVFWPITEDTWTHVYHWFRLEKR